MQNNLKVKDNIVRQKREISAEHPNLANMGGHQIYNIKKLQEKIQLEQHI